jgi:hypothetical protein
VPHGQVTGVLPAEVVRELGELRSALDDVVQVKALDRTLLIATWYVRAFGDLTEKWRSEPGDSPRRDLASLMAIATIIDRFDVVAVQQVRGNLRCLRHALKVLGPHWAMILTDVTQGHDGNDERLALLFDTRRVKPSGQACELVLPQPQRGDGAPATTPPGPAPN